MHALCAVITQTNIWLGRATAWLCLGLVVLQVMIVLNRYCFGYGSLMGLDMINYEEALLYAFSGIFLLGAAYTYIDDGHVRVDIFYAAMRQPRKDLVDLAGNLLLLMPLMILILLKSNRNLDLSWSMAEGSVDGGLPYVYLWQSLLPVFALSMAGQGIANAISLSLRLASNPRLAERIWAVIMAGLFGALLVVSLRWSTDPSWNQPNPEWRFTAYALGVWFVRLVALVGGAWSLATLAGLTPQLNEKEV